MIFLEVCPTNKSWKVEKFSNETILKKFEF